jgi:hypothetical protein
MGQQHNLLAMCIQTAEIGSCLLIGEQWSVLSSIKNAYLSGLVGNPLNILLPLDFPFIADGSTLTALSFHLKRGYPSVHHSHSYWRFFSSP